MVDKKSVEVVYNTLKKMSVNSFDRIEYDPYHRTAEMFKITVEEVEAIINDEPVEPPKKKLNMRFSDKDKDKNDND